MNKAVWKNYLCLFGVSCSLTGCCGPRQHANGYYGRLYKSYTAAPGDVSCYEEILDIAIHTKNPAIRFACGEALRVEPSAEACLRTALNNCNLSESERDFAARILFYKGTQAAFASVAPYFVAKLRNPYYVFRDLAGSQVFSGVDLNVLEEEKDGMTKIIHQIETRSAFSAVVKIGKFSITYLLPLLQDRDLTVRMNAFGALKEITSLELPFEPVAGKDKGVVLTLERAGWLARKTRTQSP